MSETTAADVTASSVTRVLIADDQHLVRTGFRLILDAQPDIEVVGEAADGATCVEMARRLRPDVCLVDIRMPALDGLEVTRILAGPDSADRMRVVVITTFDQDDYVSRALHHGACGFLLKDASPALLVDAVRAARRGDALISPAITVRLLRQLEGRHGPSTSGGHDPRAVLTARELDVARLVAVGRTNQEICGNLFLSLGTVKTHLTNIQSKLAVRNRVEIAAWAWSTGTVSGYPGLPE
ncbi:response regulator transcription factor [Streptomyces niveus]|uniref:Response regulator transcription factor n=1 Tax=Streptomyces niveus TaxID=193462 RepID=A0ABZ2A2L3_STRNV|nr:response regulator transcription factor [Streptomyces niveus]WTA61218.1 response regulator transcription factor [Streptomyces niveus]